MLLSLCRNCRPCVNNVPGVTRLRPVQRLASKRLYATRPAQTATSNTTRNSRSPAPKPFVKTEGKVLKPTPPSSASAPFAGTKGNAPPTPSVGKGYPERLLIYHAGTGRTVFISSFKLTAIFIFIFSSVFIAPGYYYSAYEETWMAPVGMKQIAIPYETLSSLIQGTVFVGGAIPLLVMVFTTAPFVAYVHLALPLWARASQPRLVRYAQNLPSTTILDITSVRWIWPRVTRLHASELYIHKSQIGSMTIRRNIPKVVSESRTWWQWRPLSRFYIAGKGGKTAEPGIWEEVLGFIAKNSKKKDSRPEIKLASRQ